MFNPIASDLDRLADLTFGRVPDEDSAVLARRGERGSAWVDGHREHPAVMDSALRPDGRPGLAVERVDATRGITDHQRLTAHGPAPGDGVVTDLRGPARAKVTPRAVDTQTRQASNPWRMRCPSRLRPMEYELIAAGRLAPFAIRLSVKEHVNPLEDKAMRLTREADEALHSEDVDPAFTEQLAKPQVQPVRIYVALNLDGDRAHLVVVLVLCDPGSLDLGGDHRAIRVRQVEIELFREVLGVKANPHRRVDLQEERLAPWRIELESRVHFERNLFRRVNGRRRFGVSPHTPHSARSRSAASSVPWSDTTTSDISGSGPSARQSS